MRFPLTFLDINLWLAAIALILLATSEILSPYYGRTGIFLDRRKLRIVAFVVGIIFMATFIVRMIGLTIE